MVLNSPSIFQILTAAAALGAATSTAQSVQQPTANTSVTSFSGQGSIPFQYTASDASAVSSVNVALVQDGLDFVLANGLLGDGGEYAAVFAPISGFCGDVTLRVTENQGNSSSDPTSRQFAISCGPVQRTRSLSARQDGGSGGPSGSLTTPTGGASYNSPDGNIQITYQPVTDGGQTFGIDAALISELGNFTLTNGLWKTNSSRDISGNFAIPSGACGPFNLQITEHQFFQNGAISFQSASPSINISCISGSDGNTNATVPTNSTRLPLPTSTGINATSTANNSTSTSMSLLPTANATTSSMILTNSSTPLSTSTSVTVTNSTAATLVPTVTTAFNSTSLLPTSANSTTSTSTSTSTTPAAPTFTGNITLPIETSTITQPTTIVSTVITTFTQSGQPGTLTSVVTTTVSPSSTLTSSNSTSSSSTSSPASSSSSSTTPNSGGGGGGGIRTTTVTATPTSEQGNGITTVTVTPTNTPSNTQSATPERRTSTYTTTEVVVIAQQGRSSITSTRLQTVILVSQTIAAIVQPSSSSQAGSAPNNTPSGAATVGMQIVPWTVTMIVSLVTVAIFNRAF